MVLNGQTLCPIVSRWKMSDIISGSSISLPYTQTGFVAYCSSKNNCYKLKICCPIIEKYDKVALSCNFCGVYPCTEVDTGVAMVSAEPPVKECVPLISDNK